MPLVDFPLAALRDVAMGLVFVLFVLTALVLTVVILLQEGKGGGLGSAFGGAAADAFGVKAGTVNKFTSYLAAGFLGLALLYAGLSAGGDKVSIGPDPQPIPSISTPSGTPTPPVESPGDNAPNDDAPNGNAPNGNAPNGDAPSDGAAPGDGAPKDGAAPPAEEAPGDSGEGDG